jgi:hypothetical protein
VGLRNKNDSVAERLRVRGPVEKMQAFLKTKKSVSEKLGAVDKAAKEYFRESYGLSVGMDYGALLSEFEKKKRVEEAEFCKKIFEIYYSDKKLTLGVVEDLGKLLVEADGKKKRRDNISEVPSFLDKVVNFVQEKRDVVLREFKDYREKKGEDTVRMKRGVAKMELEIKKWVLDAIDRGYDKSGVSKLLKEGKRGWGKKKKILKVYDSELARANDKKARRMYGEVKAKQGGIAERIIEKERSRLGNKGASSFGFF